MSISLKTHKILWGKSSNKCSFPGCKKELVMNASETDDPSVIGEEAHIVARKNNGPRGKSTLSSEERDKENNLILMCSIHHKLVDDQPLKYTVEVLHEFKKDHEKWINSNLSSNSTKSNLDYSECIDRLHSKSKTARVSAVIELGEISKNIEFQNKIIEILISHIKEHSKKLDSKINIYKAYKVKSDLQNALKIIGKRNTSIDIDLVFDFTNLNFNGILLDNVDLSNMDFSGSQFVHSRITNSNFDNSVLNNCDFRHADLSDSVMTNSKIGAVNFQLAKLNNNDFSNSHLGNSLFKNTNLENVNFSDVTMFATEFVNTNLLSIKNLNQERLYWAFGENCKIPKNYILRTEPLLQFSHKEGEGYENSKPIIYEIPNEKKTLDLFLGRK